MSVCRKLPDGTVQKIAGHTILLDANASEVRQGTFNITGGPAGWVYQTITFTDPMPDTDYTIVLECNNQAWGVGNSSPGPFIIQNKATTGFVLAQYNTIGAEEFSFIGTYTAWKPVKIEGYTELQNKINNPDETPTIDSMNLVTSGGVYEAIKNASAVWKGTKAEWNALPAAEKQTYDLAVLLDTTLVKAVDREDGTETDVANLNKIWRGTKAAWDALTSAQKNEYDQAEVIDEYTGVPVVVDKVEAGNLNPVTSNAVAGKIPQPYWTSKRQAWATGDIDTVFTAPAGKKFIFGTGSMFDNRRACISVMDEAPIVSADGKSITLKFYTYSLNSSIVPTQCEIYLNALVVDE